MTQYIIITSIFPPTEAVEAFSKVQDHQLIVVGDKKTPDNWQHNNVQYLSVQDQEDSGYALAKVMPYNHYCRKMLGYLEAMKQGAETIVDTDDDNIPKANWQFPSLEATYSALPGGEGFVNIYQLFTDQKIWPRGLPLNLINTDFSWKVSCNRLTAKLASGRGWPMKIPTWMRSIASPAILCATLRNDRRWYYRQVQYVPSILRIPSSARNSFPCCTCPRSLLFGLPTSCEG